MARYDVNRLGRFSSPDPIAGSSFDPQSMNRYSYSRNDPVNLIDPSGMMIWPLEWGLPGINVMWANRGYDPFAWTFEQLGSAPLYHSDDASFPFESYTSDQLGSLARDGVIQLLGWMPVYELVPNGSGEQASVGQAAPLNNRNQNRFVRARQKALRGLDNPDCQKFLREHGIDPAWVRSAINSQVPHDASKSTITIYDANTYPPYANPPAFFHTMSISQYFKVNLTTMGMAEALGPSAYYRPGGIFGSGGIKSGNIFHEALHNATGLSDPDLAEQLGVQGGDSKDINPALKANDCIK